MACGSEFEPDSAFIVQNKAEITVPLDLSAIPTPKEFKEAIESLSETQRQFAQVRESTQRFVRHLTVAAIGN